MQIASWLLATSTLVAPHPGPAATAPAIHPASAPSASFAPQQRQRQVAPSVASTATHRVGIGGGLAVSNYGISGSTRYWFSRHVGMAMQAGWYRPRTYYSGYASSQNQSSTATATPSLMVTFNQTDPNREVSLRPYLGVGATYAHASRSSQAPGGVTAGTTYSGVTPQGYGGAELLFRDYPNLAISAEASYYKLPSSFVNSRYVNGLNFQIAAHFYLK